MKVCVSDGEIAGEFNLYTAAGASVPQLLSQPLTSEISIPGTSSIIPVTLFQNVTHMCLVKSEGAIDYPIAVEGMSLPPPSYQWERLAPVVHNDTNISNISARFYMGDEVVQTSGVAV